MQATADQQLKNLIKEAFVELLEERRDLLRDVFEEAMEGIALARAIEDGYKSESISRTEVFSVFEDTT